MMVMYLSQDGNNTDQVEYMHKKTTEGSNFIRGGGVQQNEFWKAMNSTFPKPTKYPLPAMSLNEK